jgi:hypothetical protein
MCFGQSLGDVMFPFIMDDLLQRVPYDDRNCGQHRHITSAYVFFLAGRVMAGTFRSHNRGAGWGGTSKTEEVDKELDRAVQDDLRASDDFDEKTSAAHKPILTRDEIIRASRI